MSAFPRLIFRLLPVLALFAWLAMAPIVSAQDAGVTLNVSAIESAQAGTTIELVAELTGADGKPLSEQYVEFSLSVEFMAIFDEVEIGNAVTDESGIARIDYVLKAEGEHTLVARTTSKAGKTVVSAGRPLTVLPGSGQLYREQSPVRIPGANVWMVAIVLLVVWSVFLLIALRIWQIASLGESTGDRADA